jgi:hypothetical protein
MRRLATLVLILFFYLTPTLAGRPVFHEPTLQEIVAGSAYVAVVALSQKIEPQKNSCEPQIIKLKVLEILKPKDTKQQKSLLINNVIEVINNQTSLRDCSYRKAHPGGSGVSFPAQRYRGFELWSAKPKDQFIVFLNHNEGTSPTLAMDGAMESLEKRAAIQKLILK